MTIKEIVEKYLKDNGFNGLVDYTDECNCICNEHFMGCETPSTNCEAAHIHPEALEEALKCTSG